MPSTGSLGSWWLIHHWTTETVKVLESDTFLIVMKAVTLVYWMTGRNVDCRSVLRFSPSVRSEDWRQSLELKPVERDREAETRTPFAWLEIRHAVRECGKEDLVFSLSFRQCWYMKTDDLALGLASRRVSAGKSLWNVHCRLQYKYKILTRRQLKILNSYSGLAADPDFNKCVILIAESARGKSDVHLFVAVVVTWLRDCVSKIHWVKNNPMAG